MSYKRPPLTRAPRTRRDIDQDEATDEMSSLLVGATIEGLTVGLGVDNRLYLKISRPAQPTGDARRTKTVTLVCNELGIWVDK